MVSSGYLTRKLVESTREWVIDEMDCCIKDGLCVDPIIDLEFIKNRLIGRYLSRNILSNGKIIARKKWVNYCYKHKWDINLLW